MKKSACKLHLLLLSAAAVFTAGQLFHAPVVRAQTPAAYDEAAVQKGLQIAPVTLNLAGRDRNQVGYGSYLVNAVGGCNDCHTNPSFRPEGDPYRGLPKSVNAAGYMGGGTAFGPFISRNITPSTDGPVLGNLANFKRVIRTGEDVRKLHPEISPLLQVMPWPVYQDMTDRDLDAIYAYLSSIPCVEGGPDEKPNRCGRPAVATTAVAEPKTATVLSSQIQLDGTKSTSADGRPLIYRWQSAPGSPAVAILRADTATPIVQFSTGPITYRIELTVTDSTGASSTDMVTLNYARSF
jgi:hypothetical protein